MSFILSSFVGVASFAGYDLRWLAIAVALLAVAVYTSLCRRVLDVFSRRRLYELAPKERHDELKRYLDSEDDYLSSLRSLDLLLRLALVLTFAFGRFSASRADWIPASPDDVVPFWGSLGGGLRLAVEILLVFIVFLEIVPWVLARVRTEVALLRMLRSVDAVHRILQPFRRVFGAVVTGAVRLVGGTIEQPSVDALEEEISTVAEEGEREGLLASRDIDMLRSIVTFGGKRVAEVLTPRTEMTSLDVEADFGESLAIAIDCGHSRIPVFEGSKDQIIGILYVKDLLRTEGPIEETDLRRVVREPHFVSVDKKIGELLQEFKSQRFHIAMVRDEHGGIAGLVTIEDIIEEIVGEITDEFDPDAQSFVRRLGPGVVEIDARVPVDELNSELGTQIPEDDAYETVGGFLYTQWGRIPRIGEESEFDGLRFRVVSADDRRIRRLVLHYAEGRAAAPSAVK